MARRMPGVRLAGRLAWGGSVTNGHWSDLHPPQPPRTSNFMIMLLAIVVFGAAFAVFVNLR